MPGDLMESEPPVQQRGWCCNNAAFLLLARPSLDHKFRCCERATLGVSSQETPREKPCPHLCLPLSSPRCRKHRERGADFPPNKLMKSSLQACVSQECVAGGNTTARTNTFLWAIISRYLSARYGCCREDKSAEKFPPIKPCFHEHTAGESQTEFTTETARQFAQNVPKCATRPVPFIVV